LLQFFIYSAIIAIWYSYIPPPSQQQEPFTQIEQIEPNALEEMSKFQFRDIKMSVLAKEQAEGMGAKVRRSIGTKELRNLDPFLMLDHFFVESPAGFPDHPHRGFETVTYMVEGKFVHEDFCGHKGYIGPGDLQWMTAGKGIVHAEMPASKGVNSGLQLWVNLAGKNKMCNPSYQELLDKDIPRTTRDGVTVKVIAGESMGIKSPVITKTPTMYLDFSLEPNSTVIQNVPSEFNGFAYILSGTAVFGTQGKLFNAFHTLVFDKGDSVEVTTKDSSVRFVLVAGLPLNEPVVQHGPFVMNTPQQIQEAMMDYQNGRNGFEGAQSFESSISQGVI